MRIYAIRNWIEQSYKQVKDERLRLHDMRWQAAAAAVFLGFVVVAALCARYLSQVRMTRSAAVSLVAANTFLAVVGSLAVAPGTTDSFAYGVATESSIIIAAVYFVRGPCSASPRWPSKWQRLRLGCW